MTGYIKALNITLNLLRHEWKLFEDSSVVKFKYLKG